MRILFPLCIAAALAAPQVADACSSLTVLDELTCSSEVSGRITSATSNQITGPYFCGSPYSNLPQPDGDDVYSFACEADGSVTLEVSGLDCDLDIYILSGSCSASSSSDCVAGSTAASTTSDEVTFTCSAGTTYYVVIEGYGYSDSPSSTGYCSGGEGTVESKGKTYDIYSGVGIVVPPDVTFSMHCTSDEDLGFFCIAENVPDDFTPKTEIQWVDEASANYSSNDVHWTHNYKTLFRRGTVATFSCGPVWFTPMTMSQPHSHGGRDGSVEEIWFSLTDGVSSLLGKELRPFNFGTAYKVPSDNQTPHANINLSDTAIKVFWFMN